MNRFREGSLPTRITTVSPDRSGTRATILDQYSRSCCAASTKPRWTTSP